MAGSVASVFLNEVDITPYCVEGSATRRLNGVGTASVKVNFQSGITDTVGGLLKVYFDGTLFHHGRVLLREVTGAEDGGYAVYNSSDPLELWQHRPVRDDDGDFSKPLLIENYLYGPEITAAMVVNSAIAGAGPPSDAEGPTRLAINSVATGVVSLVGAPTDWPMTMAELTALLVSTGTLDVVCTPIELDGFNNYGQLDLYNGDYGTDRSSTVKFSYGQATAVPNIRSFRWNTDMTNMCNKLWYFIGPKCDDQHWDANITGDRDMSECDPCRCSDSSGCTCNDIRDAIVAINEDPGGSRDTYDVRMDIKIFDGIGDSGDCAPHTPPPGMCLYDNLWLNESFLRQKPQELVHITPARDTEILTFDIGDLISVDLPVMETISGVQRVYGYTLSWDAEESVIALSELQTSSDNEGMAV